MHDAFSNGWFDGYDWVIRINPDVVIYNETNIFKHLNNPEVNGVFAWCNQVLHTDFFAMRPQRLPKDIWADWAANHIAEEQTLNAFKPMLESGTGRSLNMQGEHQGPCRINVDGILHSGDPLSTASML